MKIARFLSYFCFLCVWTMIVFIATHFYTAHNSVKNIAVDVQSIYGTTVFRLTYRYPFGQSVNSETIYVNGLTGNEYTKRRKELRDGGTTR